MPSNLSIIGSWCTCPVLFCSAPLLTLTSLQYLSLLSLPIRSCLSAFAYTVPSPWNCPNHVTSSVCPWPFKSQVKFKFFYRTEQAGNHLTFLCATIALTVVSTYFNPLLWNCASVSLSLTRQKLLCSAYLLCSKPLALFLVHRSSMINTGWNKWLICRK